MLEADADAVKQKVLLHDLARSMIFSRTHSEKQSNEKANDFMGSAAQDELISTIYQRIAEKKPHVVSQIDYLGQGDSAQSQAEQAGDVLQSQLELKNEIVTTQITQVAFFLRQKKRAFDTACTLELLSKDFMSRNSCVEPSRDLSKGPADEFRPKILKLSKNAEIVQLLLALSKDPNGAHVKSDFANKFLKQKMKSNEDQSLFVRPHLAEYLQSDCQQLERDKTMGGRSTYLAFDTNSFHNPAFKQYKEANDQTLGGAQPYRLADIAKDVNRFNCDLVNQTELPGAVGKVNKDQQHFKVGVSASDGQNPTLLMGATLRSLDQANKVGQNKNGLGQGGGLFGATEIGSSSAFGMTLQIPSLPPINQNQIFKDDGSIDESNIQPTFSFFQPASAENISGLANEAKQESPQVVNKARLTITAQPQNPNKRQQKLEQKKIKKNKVSVWSLLPYVNEKLLDHNMEKESGIKRMWEDDSIHLNMQNLSLCEPGVITAQKEASFRACFKAEAASVIRVPGSSKTIKERELVRSLILVLQGIPSQQVFELEKTTFTFNTNPNLIISDICCMPESLQQLCSEFTQSGCYFLHLREFSEFMSSHKSQGAGQVVEAFALAIQDFLVFYQHQVNELERKARDHREDTLKLDEANSGQKYVSLLEIKVMMAPLLQQISTIASICFTSKFIEDIQLQNQLKKGTDSADQSMDYGPNDELKFMSLLFQRNALTAANLKEQLEENLERIRSDKWLNEFPKGARLLTYLYRIVLMSEADLQIIGLLRKIFAQAVCPILLMISEFVTIGTFEDPFSEFFVEKLYRTVQVDERGEHMSEVTDKSDDFIYKISSDQDKIPVFLCDTAVIIFKIGCDLNLLKTKRKQIITETQQQSKARLVPLKDANVATQRLNLPDYFAICAKGHIDENGNQGRFTHMVDQASRILSLDFSVQALQEKHESDRRLFEHQSNLLQKIEREIAQEETNALLQLITLKEKAAVFKMTESEKQRIKDAKERADIKRKAMKEIQDQIEERKQMKEAREVAKQAEYERQRQEEAEYEKLQKEIAEHMRGQLLELLKQNQTIADTRTGDAIQKEAMENQLTELEIKAEQAKLEVQQDVPSARVDQLMTEESEPQLKADEQAMVVDYEAAGRASTVKQGGLARLVFGKGEEDSIKEKSAADESSEEDKIKRVEDSGSSDELLENNGKEVISPEEIQLDLADDEKKLIDDKKYNPEENKSTASTVQEQMTAAEKIDFVRDVFIKPLMSRVFKFVNEKQAMESKRKTWNLKHQETQVAHIRKQKTNWEYQRTSKKSIKQKMDELFEEHAEQSGENLLKRDKVAEEKLESSDDVFKVPVSLAIQQNIIQVVTHQHKLVNKCLLHMMHRGMFLLRHLEYLKMIFLASQGDVFASFHESVFNDDFQQTAVDSSLLFLNMQLEHAVRSSRPERKYTSYFDSSKFTTSGQSGGATESKPIELGVNLAQLISEDGTELTKFKFVASGKSSQMAINPNFFFTISNIGEFVKLEYQTEHPLDRVISQQCMSKYNTLFFFLLKLKRTIYCLTLLWKELNGAEFRRISPEDFKQLRKLQFLWQQMQYFLKTIDEYVTVAVIQSQWVFLKKQLAQINYFEELINLHNSYLDVILEKCFLSRVRDNRLQITLNQIFEFVFKFHFMVLSHGVDICRNHSVKKQMDTISVQFRDYSRFLYQIVRNLSHKGQFKELFIRLDFNKFYQNSTTGTVPITISRNIIH